MRSFVALAMWLAFGVARADSPDPIEANIALAKQPDSPANRVARAKALDSLSKMPVKKMRPVWLAMLKEPPFTERDRNGGMSDPRGFFHLYAIEGLVELGFDDEVARVLLAYAASTDDKATDRVLRHGIYDSIPRVAKTLTPKQKATLLAEALDPRSQDANASGTLYAMYAATEAEIDQLKKAPPENPPYYFGYADTIAAVHRVLACRGARPCLIALLETAIDRQSEPRLLDRVQRELGYTPNADTVPTLLAMLDELEAARDTVNASQQFAAVIELLGSFAPRPCGACVAHAEATLAAHAGDNSWSQTPGKDALDVLREKTPVARSNRHDAFVSPIAYQHVAMGIGTWDPDIFAKDAFVIGRTANEVGTPALETAKRDVAAYGAFKGNIKSLRGVHGSVMWDAGRPLFSKRPFVSQLVVEDHGVYRTRAMMIADPIDDRDAKKSPAPAEIADAHADAELDKLARDVLSSRKRFVAALSRRGDAFSFGSSQDDEWPAGAAKAAFEKLGGDFKIHDGVHVERVADDAGFAFANVAYLGHTYRVFIVLVKDGGAWTIPLSHWSLAAI
ncbi:MAG TPA: hypothetical protein VGC41_04360 [Kofleriaceae bacterium]